ncbi:hypothetical protein MUK42_31180 [Musa troglodytarum]|uniref:Uncharacterized protein n=1 Tax=Musa troglodytarum TaxID=320322 RepID=A0A9E7FNR1_9LILI|nr:hypothetical protein MUK42_31180 [Musa troglodytarum]
MSNSTVPEPNPLRAALLALISHFYKYPQVANLPPDTILASAVSSHQTVPKKPRLSFVLLPLLGCDEESILYCDRRVPLRIRRHEVRLIWTYGGIASYAVLFFPSLPSDRK